ncbi:MAG: hypothetical protein IKR48_09855 [Kiritimatiellae bacterium]|nr:hypothetical protein [Kiritimatiellia bacterium]
MKKTSITIQTVIPFFLLFCCLAVFIGCCPMGGVTINRVKHGPAVGILETNATFVVGNKSGSSVNVWQVCDDGFGYEIEVFQNGKWNRRVDIWRCATGRDVVEIPGGGSYNFTIPVPPSNGVWRVSIEYWVGEYGENPIQRISSDPQ